MEDLLSRLFVLEYPHLSQLEALFGPLQMQLGDESFGLFRKDISPLIESLSMCFEIDIHHGDFTKDKDPYLSTFDLRFSKGAALCQEILEKTFGKGAPVQSEEGDSTAYNLFFFRPIESAPGQSNNDRFELTWHTRWPKHIQRKSSPEEEKSFTTYLEKLPGVVAGFTSLDDAKAFFSRGLPTGMKARTFYGTYFTLLLEPPLDAAYLCTLWGLQQPYGMTNDMHMSNYHIELFDEPFDPALLPDSWQDKNLQHIKTKYPEFGIWRAEIELAGRPESGVSTEVWVACWSPAFDMYQHRALVRYLRFDSRKI